MRDTTLVASRPRRTTRKEISYAEMEQGGEYYASESEVEFMDEIDAEEEAMRSQGKHLTASSKLVRSAKSKSSRRKPARDLSDEEDSDAVGSDSGSSCSSTGDISPMKNSASNSKVQLATSRGAEKAESKTRRAESRRSSRTRALVSYAEQNLDLDVFGNSDAAKRSRTQSRRRAVSDSESASDESPQIEVLDDEEDSEVEQEAIGRPTRDEAPPRMEKILGRLELTPKEWDEKCASMNTSEITRGSIWEQGEAKNSEKLVEKFLIKWHGLSYLHVSWETFDDLVECVEMDVKGPVRRFLQKERNGQLAYDNQHLEEGEFFDPEYQKIERILGVVMKDEGSDAENPYPDESNQVDAPDGGKFDDVEGDSLTNASTPKPLHSRAGISTAEVKRRERRVLECVVKWEGLPYSHVTTELISDLRAFDHDVVCHLQRYWTFQKPTVWQTQTLRARKAKQMRLRRQAYQKLEKSPVYPNGGELRDYQVEGVNWLLYNYTQNRSSILADEMGLGKTLQTVTYMWQIKERYGLAGPVLVVAPLSTLLHWKREFERWTNLYAVVYHGTEEDRETIRDLEFYYNHLNGGQVWKSRASKKSKEQIFKPDCIIVSYEMCTAKDSISLREIDWDLLVVDEGHRLKNVESKLTRTLMEQFNFFSTLLLTGTPLQNNTRELWSLLHFVDAESFPDGDDFEREFGDLQDSKQVAELQERMAPYILRRMKEQVEKSVPPKEEILIEVELTTIQKRWYRALYEQNMGFLQRDKRSADCPKLQNLCMELRKCCNHPFLSRGVRDSIMTDAEREAKEANLGKHIEVDEGDLLVNSSGKLILLDKLLPKLRLDGQRVLIFSQFKIMLDVLEEFLDLRTFPYERIDGNVSGQKRQNAIDRFCDKDRDAFIMLLSTKAGGVGINLTAASTVIIYDSDWNPQNDLQAMARAHRIGQTQKVNIYRLVAGKTYEMQMFTMASLKLGLDAAVMGVAGKPKLKSKEVEDLLKKGAYAVFQEDQANEEQAKQFAEANIDQILKTNATRIDTEQSVRDAQTGKGVASASSLFGKAQFVANCANADVDVNDPDFWEKVVGYKYVPKVEKLERSDRAARRRPVAGVSEGDVNQPDEPEFVSNSAAEESEGEILEDSDEMDVEDARQTGRAGPKGRRSGNADLRAAKFLEVLTSTVGNMGMPDDFTAIKERLCQLDRLSPAVNMDPSELGQLAVNAYRYIAKEVLELKTAAELDAILKEGAISDTAVAKKAACVKAAELMLNKFPVVLSLFTKTKAEERAEETASRAAASVSEPGLENLEGPEIPKAEDSDVGVKSENSGEPVQAKPIFKGPSSEPVPTILCEGEEAKAELESKSETSPVHGRDATASATSFMDHKAEPGEHDVVGNKSATTATTANSTTDSSLPSAGLAHITDAGDALSFDLDSTHDSGSLPPDAPRFNAGPAKPTEYSGNSNTPSRDSCPAQPKEEACDVSASVSTTAAEQAVQQRDTEAPDSHSEKADTKPAQPRHRKIESPESLLEIVSAYAFPAGNELGDITVLKKAAVRKLSQFQLIVRIRNLHKSPEVLASILEKDFAAAVERRQVLDEQKPNTPWINREDDAPDSPPEKIKVSEKLWSTEHDTWLLKTVFDLGWPTKAVYQTILDRMDWPALTGGLKPLPYLLARLRRLVLLFVRELARRAKPTSIRQVLNEKHRKMQRAEREAARREVQRVKALYEGPAAFLATCARELFEEMKKQGLKHQRKVLYQMLKYGRATGARNRHLFHKSDDDGAALTFAEMTWFEYAKLLGNPTSPGTVRTRVLTVHADVANFLADHPSAQRFSNLAAHPPSYINDNTESPWLRFASITQVLTEFRKLTIGVKMADYYALAQDSLAEYGHQSTYLKEYISKKGGSCALAFYKEYGSVELLPDICLAVLARGLPNVEGVRRHIDETSPKILLEPRLHFFDQVGREFEKFFESTATDVYMFLVLDMMHAMVMKHRKDRRDRPLQSEKSELADAGTKRKLVSAEDETKKRPKSLTQPGMTTLPSKKSLGSSSSPRNEMKAFSKNPSAKIKLQKAGLKVKGLALGSTASRVVGAPSAQAPASSSTAKITELSERLGSQKPSKVRTWKGFQSKVLKVSPSTSVKGRALPLIGAPFSNSRPRVFQLDSPSPPSSSQLVKRKEPSGTREEALPKKQKAVASDALQSLGRLADPFEGGFAKGKKTRGEKTAPVAKSASHSERKEKISARSRANVLQVERLVASVGGGVAKGKKARAEKAIRGTNYAARTERNEKIDSDSKATVEKLERKVEPSDKDVALDKNARAKKKTAVTKSAAQTECSEKIDSDSKAGSTGPYHPIVLIDSDAIDSDESDEEVENNGASVAKRADSANTIAPKSQKRILNFFKVKN